MSNYDEYLRSFLDIEVYFLAHPEVQREEWARRSDSDDAFGTCIWLSLESWSTIEDNRPHFKLSDLQFREMQKIFEMLTKFRNDHNFPTNPREYAATLAHPEWKSIQNQARYVYDKLNPLV